MADKNDIILSFIIPVYNAEKYLNDCVNSILNQNISDIEIILVDDGSIDKSSSICDEYSDKHWNIKTIHQKNAGVASARNAGIQAASGKYIQFLDNDDWMNEGVLNKLIEIINKTGADVIIHKYLLAGNNLSIGNNFINKDKINGKSPEEVLDYLRTSRANITAPWEYSVKKEVIVKNNISFNPSQNGVDDSVFTPMVFCSANSFYFNDNPLLSWRMRPDSQGSTHKKKDFVLKMVSVIETIKNYLEKTNDSYKREFLLFRIYKDIYSLLGPYYEYPVDIKDIVNKWFADNIDLIKESVKYSGALHKTLSVLFGSFYGTILSYKIAVLKGKIHMMIYRK